MSMPLRCRMLFLAALILPLASCSKSLPLVPAAGRVERDGKPVANAMVQFFPDLQKSPQAKIASAKTDDSGAFRLQTTPEGEGAVAGTYKVTVSGYIDKKPIPDQFSKSNLSKITVEIPAAGKTDIVIKLD